MIKTQRVHLLLPLAAQPSASDQIRPLADIVHFKYSHTYLLTYLLNAQLAMQFLVHTIKIKQIRPNSESKLVFFPNKPTLQQFPSPNGYNYF